MLLPHPAPVRLGCPDRNPTPWLLSPTHDMDKQSVTEDKEGAQAGWQLQWPPAKPAGSGSHSGSNSSNGTALSAHSLPDLTPYEMDITEILKLQQQMHLNVSGGMEKDMLHSIATMEPKHPPAVTTLQLSDEDDIIEVKVKDTIPAGCGPDAIKLFVGNIPRSYTVRQLLPLFQSVGKVAELVLVRDKRSHKSKGSAFVWYATRAFAEMAIEQFDQRVVLPDETSRKPGQPLVVRKARAPRFGNGITVVTAGDLQGQKTDAQFNNAGLVAGSQHSPHGLTLDPWSRSGNGSSNGSVLMGRGIQHLPLNGGPRLSNSGSNSAQHNAQQVLQHASFNLPSHAHGPPYVTQPNHLGVKEPHIQYQGGIPTGMDLSHPMGDHASNKFDASLSMQQQQQVAVASQRLAMGLPAQHMPGWQSILPGQQVQALMFNMQKPTHQSNQPHGTAAKVQHGGLAQQYSGTGSTAGMSLVTLSVDLKQVPAISCHFWDVQSLSGAMIALMPSGGTDHFRLTISGTADQVQVARIMLAALVESCP